VTDFTPINEAQIAYDLRGDGLPVVVIHAGIADSRMWDPQMPALSAHYCVLRYDMRGFGQSAMVEGAFTHRADLEALLARLNIERPTLIACSMGGRIALDYALAQPESVRALVLVDSVPAGFDRSAYPPPAQAAALEAADEANDLDAFNELEVQMWFDGPHRTPDQVNPQMRELVRAMNKIALQTETDALGDETPPAPAWDRLGEITCPTLLIVGALDRPDVVDAMHQMAERMPTSRLHVIDNAAHLPNMEHPDAFNRLVLDFLREL
jgi:pimeloyl-ACP methyl ester carboxylesterase